MNYGQLNSATDGNVAQMNGNWAQPTIAASISPSVTFGQPQQGGGGCAGKGLCKTFAPGAVASFDAIQVTMTTSDSNVLKMAFSLNELRRKQPEQAAYFIQSGTYNFDGYYPLTSPMFAPLGLLRNARIAPQTPNKVEIDGDTVTVRYLYEHD